MEEIDSKVERFGMWAIRDRAPVHPLNGVTTNMSEGMNVLIKDLMRWTEVPENVILVSLKLLQQYHIGGSLRSRAGLGRNISLMATKIPSHMGS